LRFCWLTFWIKRLGRQNGRPSDTGKFFELSMGFISVQAGSVMAFMFFTGRTSDVEDDQL
jgi:hypothetical protein